METTIVKPSNKPRSPKRVQVPAKRMYTEDELEDAVFLAILEESYNSDNESVSIEEVLEYLRK